MGEGRSVCWIGFHGFGSLLYFYLFLCNYLFFFVVVVVVSSSESGSEEAGSTAEAEQEKDAENELGDVENGMEASGFVLARVPGSRRLESDSD